MTFPIAEVNTVPNCGACGWTVGGLYPDLNGDAICDACGADLLAFGFAGLFPPEDLAAVGGSLQVTFTWTEAPDTSDIRYQIDGGVQVIESPVTSPHVVVAAAGETVSGEVRTVLSGVDGPWSAPESAVATA